MKERIKQLIMGLALVLGVGTFLLPATSVGAVDVEPIKTACSSTSSKDSTLCKNQDNKLSDTITTVVNVLLFIVGVISVLMIIVGGILYVVSTGDSTRITRAKNTLLYAIVGLVVAFLAYAVVNWIIARFI